MSLRDLGEVLAVADQLEDDEDLRVAAAAVLVAFRRSVARGHRWNRGAVAARLRELDRAVRPVCPTHRAPAGTCC